MAIRCKMRNAYTMRELSDARRNTAHPRIFRCLPVMIVAPPIAVPPSCADTAR